MDIKEFTVGQSVFCYSFGSWYEAEVAKLGRTRLHVTYTTGSGKTRTKAFPLSQISIEKPEGPTGRQAAYAEKRRRKIERNKQAVGEQVMQMTDDGLVPIPDTYWQLDEKGGLVAMEMRPLQLGQVDSVRLLCAFQALYMPSGFYHRTVTHKRARQIIAEMTGIHLKKTAKPPKPGEIDGLQDYVNWASNPDLQTKFEPVQEQTA